MKKKSAPALKSTFNIAHYLKSQKEFVDSYLANFLPPLHTDPKSLHEAMHYSVFAGGKRIRPILILATGEALQMDKNNLVHLACAVELIHTYSLIHDDLPSMDNDDYRRGQLTTHKKFGEGMAVLTGNALLTHALKKLSEIPSTPKRPSLVHELCHAIGSQNGMLAGQAMDLETQGKRFSKEHLEQIHSAKTGALIQSSIYCAGLIAGTSQKILDNLSSFGCKLGLAYQIVDDILDIEGSSSELGKTAGKDSVHEKATYPALYGLKASKQFAMDLVNQAIHQIHDLGPPSKTLVELARFISVRRF